MTARWRRSSAMRCTCCLEPRESSPTMPLARLPAHWLLTSTPRRSAHAVIKRALRWVSRALAFMPDLVGNFGGGRFFDYTAYGDTINVAARLEAANKQLGTRICASATLAARVEKFRGRPVGDLVLRGRMEALRAFEPLRDAQYEDPATKSYLEAFAKLEAG